MSGRRKAEVSLEVAAKRLYEETVLRAAIPEDPWVIREDRDDLGHYVSVCFWCGNLDGALHKPDCAWVRARSVK